MAQNRKLQTEIERVFKKISEGVENFEDIWGKLYSTDNLNQKEKFEADLKKEIKKLQRHRDQIKTWVSSGEVKDKKPLLEQRKLIETQMERFKACEKEMKTKAYSKEGLASNKMDPKEKAKMETRKWILDILDTLGTQIDSYEAELELLQAKKKTNAIGERIEKIENILERHKFHQIRLELILRLVDNDSLDIDVINALKDDITYYTESHEDPDFVEDPGLYDELNLKDEMFEEDYTDDSDDDNSDNEREKPSKPAAAPAPAPAPAPAAAPAPTPAAAVAPTPAAAAPVPAAAAKKDPAAAAAAVAATPVPAAAPSTAFAAKDKAGKKEEPSPAPAPAPVVADAKAKIPAAAAAPAAKDDKSKSAPAAASASPAPAPSAAAIVAGGAAAAPQSAAAAVKKSLPAPTAANTPPVASAPTTAPLSMASVVAGSTAPAAPAKQDAKPAAAQAAATPVSAAAIAAKGAATATTAAAANAPAALAPTQTSPVKASAPAGKSTAAPAPTAAPASAPAPAPAAVATGSRTSSSVGAPAATAPQSVAPPSAPKAENVPSAAATAIAGPSASLPSLDDNLITSATATIAGGSGLPGLASLLSGTGSQGSGLGLFGDATISRDEDRDFVMDAFMGNKLPSVLGDLVPTYETMKSKPLFDTAQQQTSLLETSLANIPDTMDADKLKYYVPKTPQATPLYYPQVPSTVLDQAQLYEKLDIDTLFFIFYFQQGTYQQYLAARELKKQSWRFHKKYFIWFQRHEEPKAITEEYELGTYIYFDFEQSWCQRKKADFTFNYQFLEDEMYV